MDISKFSLEWKVAQLFTVGFSGAYITPEVIEMITGLNIGGLRLSPNMACKYGKYKKVGGDHSKSAGSDPLPQATTYFSPEQFLKCMNELQALAACRPGSVPLHMAVDVEGGSQADVSRGYPLFPSVMGLAQAQDPDVFYRVGKTLGRTLRLSGVNMIHSPVLDVVDHQHSPEINTRSYGGDPEKVAQYAAATVRGLQEENVLATGKHFPGRGYSRKDVHYEKDICTLTLDEMLKGELLPYVELIEKGLPAIMLAHSSYPGLTGDETPATVSVKLIQEILREKLGFEGVITTDSITMEGILKLYPVEEACARALQAGADLVLYKTVEPSEVKRAIDFIVKWVEQGKISESQIDQSLQRVLNMKRRAGLLDNGWRREPQELKHMLADEKPWKLAAETAKAATQILHDKKKLLPLESDAKILVVEQAMFLSQFTNDEKFHPFMLWEFLNKKFENVGLSRISFFGSDDDFEAIIEKSVDYDLIVATNIYSRGSKPNTEFLNKLISVIDKPVAVITNSPYPATVSEQMETVICTYSEMPESIKVAAEIM